MQHVDNPKNDPVQLKSSCILRYFRRSSGLFLGNGFNVSCATKGKARHHGSTDRQFGFAGCTIAMVQEWGTTPSGTPRARLLQEQRKRGSGFSQAALSQAWSRRRPGPLVCVLLGAGLLLLDLLLLLLCWHSFASSTNPDPQWLHAQGEGQLEGMARPQFVLFGDSITQQSFRPGGWGAALADRYSRKADVVLRGYSGYNTRWALYLLDKIFPTKSALVPSLVTIFFGANDAALPDGDSKRQHVPIPEYKENLRQMIAHLKGLKDSIHIVLITPPPVDVRGRRAYARVMYGDQASELPERTNEVTGLYAEACQAVALEHNLPVIDLWTTMQRTANWEDLYLSDGLHLSPAGNAVVFDLLVKVLDDPAGSGSLSQGALPVDYPEHSAVDSNDPAKSFVDL